MHRRTFLFNSAAALTSSVVPSGAVIASAPGSRRAVRIRERFICDDRLAVEMLRHEVLGGHYQFVNPSDAQWFARFYETTSDVPPECSAWILWAELGECRWLLEYHGSDTPIPGAGKGGFLDWLNTYGPGNCNDWLLVPSLYRRHVFDVESIDWQIGPALTQSALLDPLLSSSRGLLYWWWQVELLLAEVFHVSRNEARTLWMRYLRQEPGTVRQMQHTDFEERPFLATIQERTGRGQCFGGWPDWFSAGFLSEHDLIR